MGIAQGRERREPRPYAEAATIGPRGGEYLLDSSSEALVPPSAFPTLSVQAKISLL